MRTIRLIAVIALLCAANTAWAQLDTLYQEYFTDSTLALQWFDPWETGSLMGIVNMPGNPSGDDWVGRIGNDSTGQVGTMLEGELNMSDYEVEAQIYCTISAAPMGAYHGVVARWDTTGGNTFYCFRSDFDTDQRLQLVKVAGAMPTTIGVWQGGEIPGGVPVEDGWHHMAFKCEGNQLWVYWDGVELGGCPFTDDTYSYGFFGLYVFKGGVTAETLCDDIIVLGDAGPQPFDLIAQESHILDTAGVELELRPAEGDSLYFSLDWQVLGGEGVSPGFLNTLYLDGAEFYREVFAGGTIPDTSYTSQADSLWGATLGWHALVWTLDQTDNVLEGNENNNVLVDSFLVLPPGAFDLAVDSSWYADPDTIPYDNDTLNIGDEVLFILDWSVPMGEGASPSFLVSMDLNGELYYTELILGVYSGNSYRSVAGPWTATEGFHYFTWMLDTAEVIDEFSEGNNSSLNGFWAYQLVGVPWAEDPAYQPQSIGLTGVFPNPFNPAVTLRYENAIPGMLSLSVYDVAGRKVAVLAEGFHPAGVWDVTWEAEGIAGGIYFAVLEGDGHRSVKPLLLVK